jgi:hypothetical protein
MQHAGVFEFHEFGKRINYCYGVKHLKILSFPALPFSPSSLWMDNNRSPKYFLCTTVFS